MKKEAIDIIKTIKMEINNIHFMDLSRNNKQDFTRKRKLSFSSLILFLLNSIKSTIQKELTNFMELLSNSCDNTKRISKSAFSQSRSKLKPEAFIHLNDILIKEFYTDNDYSMWKGHRLLAVDGSTSQLPYSAHLEEHFGHVTENNSRNFPIARISCCYDLLNKITIDSKIAPIKKGEHSLILQHIDKIQKNDLLILDRGYGAIWLFYFIMQKNGEFVTRIQRNFIKEATDFRESKEFSKIIEVKELNCNSRNKLNNGVNPNYGTIS